MEVDLSIFRQMFQMAPCDQEQLVMDYYGYEP